MNTVKFPEKIQEMIDLAPSREVLAKEILMIMNDEVEGYKYDQSAWGKSTECGTSACLAGNAILLAGFTPQAAYIGADQQWGGILEVDGQTAPLSNVAGALLGLAPDADAPRTFVSNPEYNYYEIFYTTAKREDVTKLLNDIVDGKA